MYCMLRNQRLNPFGNLARDRALSALRQILVISMILTALGLPGCGGDVQAKLEDYLEELEFDAPLEAVKVIQLGESHRISIAARKQAYVEGDEEPVWVQFKFKLFVEVAPENEAAILAATERHRGMINDIIVRICRNLTLEELGDSRRTSFKSRLIDALRPLLGENRIQQLILNDDSWEAI